MCFVGCGKTHTVKHLCDVALQAIRSAAPRRAATVAIGAPMKSRVKGKLVVAMLALGP